MQLNNINTMNFQIFFQLLSAVAIYALYNCFHNKQLEYRDELSGNTFEEQILGMYFLIHVIYEELIQTCYRLFLRNFTEHF